MNSEKIYFKNLDSIRFIAATMVYLRHGLRPSFSFLEINNIYVEKLLNTISDGELGVQIFFVLSGFLITYILITEHEMNKKINLKFFYIRRVLKIWPLYFLVVAYSFFLFPLLETSIGNTPRLGANLLYHLTFLSNFDIMNVEKYFHGSSTLAQGITWSVSIEEQFYLFWPLIFFILPKRLWIHSIIVIISGSILFRILNYDDSFVLYYHTFSVIVDLGIGAVFAYLITEQKKVKLFFEKSSTWTHLLFMIVSFSICFFRDSIFQFQYGNSIGRVFISFSFALIISAQALTKAESKLNLRNFSFANKWGKYTYGIYLLHPTAITVIGFLFKFLHISQTNFVNSFGYGVLGFILTLVFSKFSFKYFEYRFLRLKSKFTEVKSGPVDFKIENV